MTHPVFCLESGCAWGKKQKENLEKMIKSGMEFELATVAVLYIILYLINTSALVLIYFKRSYFLIDIQVVVLLKFIDYHAIDLKTKIWLFSKKVIRP